VEDRTDLEDRETPIRVGAHTPVLRATGRPDARGGEVGKVIRFRQGHEPLCSGMSHRLAELGNSACSRSGGPEVLVGLNLPRGWASLITLGLLLTVLAVSRFAHQRRQVAYSNRAAGAKVA
jgi:hypothetical protein